MAGEKEPEKILGLVERILFKNEENGYHVLALEVDGMKDTTAVLNHPNLFEGFTYEFTGEWTLHQKFGHQFKATSAVEVLPSTKDGLRSYLASSFFPGIGPVIANRIINYFDGEDVLEIFNKELDRLMDVPGISKSKLIGIKESWQKNKEINDIMMFLQNHNISTLFAKKIYEFYGKNCVSQILKNPYRLSKDISGIGFSYADRIALKVGFDTESIERLEACISFILDQGSNDGHSYLYENQIKTKSSELLKIDSKDKVSECLEILSRSNEIYDIQLEGDDSKRYYSKKLYNNEQYCAEKIHLLKSNSFKSKVDDSLFDKLQDNITLSDEQKAAVLGIVGEGVSVLTGGPGSGKTTSLKKLVKLLLSVGYELALAAPTGRASQRMTETIGLQASTIHRLLVWDHDNKTFLKNERNTIEANFIIIDETSMLDINLAASLLRAIPINAQVLFVGDVDQLPPVGPGDFFRDLISSEIAPVFRLNKIFRQGKESLIIKHAYEINEQVVPRIETPLLTPELWTDGTDCMFVDSAMPELFKANGDYPKWSSLRYGIDFINMISKLYMDYIPKYIGSDKEIQILMPMNVGELGTIKVNQVIQGLVNPADKNKKEIRIKERTFRDGDRVIQTKNNYDLEVFNGDIGKVIEISGGEKMEMTVKFSDSREVIYAKSDIFELDLAYAISIHKSQGSEFDCVILPLMKAHYRMLYKQLIYTGLTRAKKFAVFVGERDALKIAVANSNANTRQTSLRHMLLDEEMEMPI
jgi:exodeoxyribonuclease V alpha subunit